MKTIIVEASEKDTLFVAEILKRLGLKARILSSEDKEDIALANAMKKGKTGKYIDVDDFVKKLRK